MSLFILLMICRSFRFFNFRSAPGLLFLFICQYISNRFFHMPINSCLGEGWKSFLQFCYSIPTLLMQNTNLYRYLQRYFSITFAIFVHYVKETIIIMLLFSYFIALKMLKMEELLTWRNLITFYLYWK